MAYPVSLSVEPAIENRNRLTTAFRLILAIPHVFLVGGLSAGIAYQNDRNATLGGETGLLGAIAFLLAIVSWFTILITGTHNVGIRRFTLFYLRWRARVLAYVMLLEDTYPPFGDLAYPVTLQVDEPRIPRDFGTVAFRLLLALPHIIILVFVLIAWTFTTIVAWFAILFTGAYPRGLYDFGVGVLTWRLRVEAYVLLLVDEYPPFSLE